MDFRIDTVGVPYYSYRFLVQRSAILCIGFAGTLWMVFLGRIIAGVTGGNISTAQAYIADVTSRENRAKGMGLFGAAFGLGFIFGPAIGGILSRYGIHVPFLFAAGLTFANAIALYFILPESLKPEDRVKKENFRKNHFAELLESFRDSRFSLLTILYFLLVTAFSIMTATFALYTLHRFGYNAEVNGYLFAYIGILAVIMQGFLFGRLTKIFGEAWLAAFGSLLLAGAFVVVPFVGPNFGGLTALLIGIAFFAWATLFRLPALSSLASKIASQKEQGKALGMMQSAASLARAIGPAMAGVLMNNSIGKIDDFTIYRTFWTAAAIMITTFIVAIYFAKVKMKTLVMG